MEWKLPSELKPDGRQLLSQRDPLLISDRVATKAALFASYGVELENACQIYSWSLYFRRLTKTFADEYVALLTNAFSEACSADFTRFGLPVISLKVSPELQESVSMLEEIAPREALLDIIQRKHWRQIFPDLSCAVASEQDAAATIDAHIADLNTLWLNVGRARALCEQWLGLVDNCSALISRLKVEQEFWASTFSSRTSLQRWYRSFGGGEELPLADTQSGTGGPVLASMERFESYSLKASEFDGSWALLDQKSEPDAPSYFELLETLQPEAAEKRILWFQTSRCLQNLQLAILQCDWNQTITSFERLRHINSNDAVVAEAWLVAAVDALQAEADFVNLNMLLDCCGDRFPASALSLEDLRDRTDRSAKLLDQVTAANATRFGMLSKTDLQTLRVLGVNTPGVRHQRRRRLIRNALAATACVFVACLFIAFSLYRNRDYGSTNLALDFEPKTSFDSADLLLLPRFDAASRLTHKQDSPKSDTAAKPDAPTAVPEQTPGAESAINPEMRAAVKTVATADRDAKIAKFAKEKMGEVQRQIARIEASYDDQQANLMRTSKDTNDVEKQYQVQKDKIQDDFAELRQTRSRQAVLGAQRAAEKFSKLLTEITLASTRFAQAGIAHNVDLIKNNAAFRAYYPGWRVIAKINGQEAFTGLKLFASEPPSSTEGAWTQIDINKFAKYAYEQVAILEGAQLVFSVAGVNIVPPYEKRIPLESADPIKPLYVTIKSLAVALAQQGADLELSEASIQKEQKGKYAAAEDVYQKRKKTADDDRRKQLSDLEAKRNRELEPWESRHAAFSGRTGNNQELNGLAMRAWSEMFEEFWNADGVLKTTTKSQKYNFGLQPHGDYQLLVRVKTSGNIRIYRSDFRVTPLHEGVWQLLLGKTIKVFQDAELLTGVAHESN